MPTVTPVDYDPFAATSPKLTEVDYDPFGGSSAKLAAPAKGALETALEPITSYPAVQGQMAREAYDTMAAGASKAVAPNSSMLDRAAGAGMAALGGVSYVASPVNAALKTLIGRPVENVTGLPQDYTEFAAGLAIPGIGMTRMPGAAAKGAAKAPTVDQLKASYKASKESPVVAEAQIKPDSVARAVDEIKINLDKEWLDSELARPAHRILDRLMEAPPEGGLVTMANIDSARRLLGKMAGRGDENAAAAQIAKKGLDDWMAKATQADAFSGNIQDAQRIMQSGRADYAAAKVGEAFDTKINKAEARANTTYSGLNLQNQLRQKAEQFLDSADSRALSAGERKMVEQLRDGNFTQNSLRYIGKFFGGGGGLGALASTSAGAGAAPFTGGLSLAAPVVGYATTKLASHLTMKQAERVSEALRSRSPLGKQLNASLASWGKYAKIAEQKPLTPRIVSMLAIQSRNLSNNLKDAGIEVAPADLVRDVLPGLESEDRR